MNCFAKNLLPFAASFLLALGLTTATTALFDKQRQGFTAEEARSLIGKQVQSVCNAKGISPEDTKGKVEFFQESDWNGEIHILVHWENSLRGKHELFFEGKDFFDKCTRVVE